MRRAVGVALWLFAKMMGASPLAVSVGIPDLVSLQYHVPIASDFSMGLHAGLMGIPGLNLLIKNIQVEYSDDYGYQIAPSFVAYSSGVFVDWKALERWSWRGQAGVVVVKAGGRVFLKNTASAKTLEVADLSATVFQPVVSFFSTYHFNPHWELGFGVSFLPPLAFALEMTGSLIGYMDVSPESVETIGRGFEAVQKDASQTLSQTVVPWVLPALSVRYRWD